MIKYFFTPLWGSGSVSCRLMIDFHNLQQLLKEMLLHVGSLWDRSVRENLVMSPREETPQTHHVFYLVNCTVNKTFNDWKHCASFLMCRFPARGKTGATWILNASCEVQKPCAQNTESEIFPSSHLQKKIRPVFGNKRIPVPATDMTLPEQPYLSTRLSRNRGLRQRNDPWLFQKCQLFIITKSSVLRRAWTRDRSTHAQGPPRGLRLYTSCSRSAAQCLLFCDIRDGVGGEESGRHGALTSFKLWSHTINIFSVLDFRYYCYFRTYFILLL